MNQRLTEMKPFGTQLNRKILNCHSCVGDWTGVENFIFYVCKWMLGIVKEMKR